MNYVSKYRYVREKRICIEEDVNQWSANNSWLCAVRLAARSFLFFCRAGAEPPTEIRSSELSKSHTEGQRGENIVH